MASKATALARPSSKFVTTLTNSVKSGWPFSDFKQNSKLLSISREICTTGQILEIRTYKRESNETYTEVVFVDSDFTNLIQMKR